MSYQSIDQLQNSLGNSIFAHTKDRKKAAGRALGTLVEIITYYLLNEWGLKDCIAIEMSLPEYGNKKITHNVEFTLHPLIQHQEIEVEGASSITSNRIAKALWPDVDKAIKAFTLVDKALTIKNAGCLTRDDSHNMTIANLEDWANGRANIGCSTLHDKPFAMFECKRVGVEEGCKKGPQTIEKAKQGAYVAQMTSALQKIWNEQGERMGLIYRHGHPIIKPYAELLRDIVNENDSDALADFTLSVGIISNHGNWFTSDDQNKELRVLSQSYDRLLFLTDQGLSTFIQELLLAPQQEYRHVRQSFLDSYKEGRKANIFTKSKINYRAHRELQGYFHNNIDYIESWFNVISPARESVKALKQQLYTLKTKDWKEILK